MPVSTRSRANLRDDEQDLRAQTSHEGSPQGILPTIRIGALSDQNVLRSNNDISDVPISNEPVDLNLGYAPPLMLLQQHMDVSELRGLVSKLSDNQASMMDFLQSLIEPHPDRNLDFSQSYSGSQRTSTSYPHPAQQQTLNTQVSQKNFHSTGQTQINQI